MKKSIIMALLALHILHLNAQNKKEFYLAKTTTNNADGSINKPFSDINKIQQIVRDNKNCNCDIKIIIRQGTYELSEPLIFNSDDGGDSLHSIEYCSYPGESATFSGGKSLAGTWRKVDNNIWRLKLKSFSKDKDIFRSLFVNGKRLKRASSDTFFSIGPLPQFKNSLKKFDFDGIRRLVKDSIDIFCGFVYSDSLIDGIKDLWGAEAIVYNSWEASWNTIRNIDKGNHIIYFKNPMAYPVGFFSPRIRFRIENSLDYLDSPGEWQLDYQTGQLSYFAFPDENPNNLKFIVPVLDSLLVIKGDIEKRKYVKNIKFSNINFGFTSSAWGVNSLEKSTKKLNSEKHPWIDFSQGFSCGFASSPDCGEAILLEAAENCSFENCSFKHLGNYAIRIGKFASNNTISNASISDIGGGGIIIGFNISGGKHKEWPDEISPSYNRISNCNISNCGVIFPSGVGIGIMQANHSTINLNTIYNLPYSGISCGWSFSFADTYNNYNHIEKNYISNVMTTLADGGGIYTLGKQTGSIFRYNYIENIFHSKSAVPSENNGFFFDVGSSDFLVDSNIVINIQNEDYRFNKTDSTKIQWGTNYFEKNGNNKDIQSLILQKVRKVTPAINRSQN